MKGFIQDFGQDFKPPFPLHDDSYHVKRSVRCRQHNELHLVMLLWGHSTLF